MKWLVVAGFILCFVNDIRAGVLNKSELPSGKECLPGTSWKSQCNECTCMEDGFPACTEQHCEGFGHEDMLRCLPDSVWQDECNTCSCTHKGIPLCTKIGCNIHIVTDFNPLGQDDAKGEDISAPDIENDVNHPAIEDFDDFNEHELTKRSVCEANERFEIDCNSCKCDPTGQRYSCTQSECLEIDMDKEVEVFKESEGADHVERHSVCKPRATFHVGCNTCQCNLAGTDFVCATKPCPLLNQVELFHEIRALKTPNITKAVVCAANRMFIKDCNTCWCNEDGTGYFCTRKVCVPDFPEDASTEQPEELRVIKRQCRPDEVFELDCNMCRCNPDGQSFSCTRRACVPEEDGKNASLFRSVRSTPQASSKSDTSATSRFAQVKETPKTCQPGQEFRMDCNKCLCDNEGQDFSCTRIDCAALNNNNNGGTRRKREVTSQVTMECTPGSVFERGCKVCRCAQDGRHAVCPARCQHEEHAENEVSNTDSDPGFRCNPGEQFKRSCNDCTCSADGRSYFCTLRLCEEEITPTI